FVHPCRDPPHLHSLPTRRSSDLSPISRHLALAVTASQQHVNEADCRIVGVDLAGFEDRTTRAAYFAQDFVGVHRCGLAVTAHAGDRKSTRLNSSHVKISYAVFCL